MKAKICVGLSGSGKTTFVKEYLNKNSNTVRVNRDDLRTALTAMPSHIYMKNANYIVENNVSFLIKAFIEESDIIFDNTN